MEKVKVLIVEDEMIISTNLKFAVESSGYFVTNQVINYTEAIKSIEQDTPDIAILDIKLSGKKTGIDIAEEINKTFKFPFIFLTSYTDKLTIEEVKHVKPAAFLVKPFNSAEIATSIEIALYNFSKEKETAFNQDNLIIKDCLFIKSDKSFIRLNFKDIVYLKSDHIYIEIYMHNGKRHVVRASLNDYINKLSKSFFRCHRSYIVNINFLQEVKHNELMISDQCIPLGKTNREELLNLLNRP